MNSMIISKKMEDDKVGLVIFIVGEDDRMATEGILPLWWVLPTLTGSSPQAASQQLLVTVAPHHMSDPKSMPSNFLFRGAKFLLCPSFIGGKPCFDFYLKTDILTIKRVGQLVGDYSNLIKSLEFESLGTQLRLNYSVERALLPLWSCPARIRISRHPMRCLDSEWFNQKKKKTDILIIGLGHRISWYNWKRVW